MADRNRGQVRTFAPVPKVAVGDAQSFVGPQRSLRLDAPAVILVGDETSVAVAAAYAAEKRARVHAVIRSASPDDVRRAAATVGLHEIEVVPSGDRAATDASIATIAARCATAPETVVALTGSAELVVGMRASLRAAGVRNLETKAYWIPGRTGLD